MCAKRERRCPALVALRESALQEWCEAESFEEVRSAWARLGGLVTLHRYGREHFSLLARVRHGDREARVLLALRSQRRRGGRR
jgi:hypothetical protein